ncbi:MAG TPA: CBS domain-containing protein [Micromonosporaceae bacterium]
MTHHRTVRDVMTWDVVTVCTGTPYREIVDLMTERKVSALPVLDVSGAVVGVVSEADLLHKLEFRVQHGPAPRFSVRHRAGRVKATGTVAADLMSAPPVTISPDASVATAARVMDAESVKRLPVLNDNGDLVGIVSRRDLLRVFLRSDEELREEVTTQVVRRVLWASPADVQVRVASGVVTLTGTVERRGLISLAEQLTRAVDGVVDVVCHLDYDLEDDESDPHSAPIQTLRLTSPMF